MQVGAYCLPKIYSHCLIIIISEMGLYLNIIIMSMSSSRLLCNSYVLVFQQNAENHGYFNVASINVYHLRQHFKCTLPFSCLDKNQHYRKQGDLVDVLFCVYCFSIFFSL